MEVGPTCKLYGFGNGPSLAGSFFNIVILECDIYYQWLNTSDIGIDHRAGMVYRRKQKARSSGSLQNRWNMTLDETLKRRNPIPMSKHLEFCLIHWVGMLRLK